jgi:acetyl esterase/lipase
MDRINALIFSKRTGGRVLSTSYRLAPQYKFPCAVIDIISVYQHLIKLYSPSKIFVSGISAGFYNYMTLGGGLSMALILAAKEMNLPLPAGAVLISPWVLCFNVFRLT